MKLSVIIVNYNVKFFLEQCLYSVLKAAEKIPTEIIVVDNHSVDGSVDMLQQKFPQVRLLANTENKGFSVANNQAIQLSTGEYILLLNPDTVVEEDTFLSTVQFLDNQIDAGGLGVKMLDGKGKFLPESKRGLPTPAVAFYKIFGLAKLFPQSHRFGKYHLGYLNKDQIHAVDVLSGAFMMLRRSVLKEIGLLDERFFMYGEDIDLSYRIILAGYKNYYFPNTRIIHYKGESTKKGSINYVFVFYRAMILFAQKHFSHSNARFFSFLINIAIYIRASMALLKRFFDRIFLSCLDAFVLFVGLKLCTNTYAKYIKFASVSGSFPVQLVNIAFVFYVLCWLLGLYIAGGYQKPPKLSKVFPGIGLGSLGILLIYALMPEQLRFSRAIIIIGTCWALLSLIGLRLLLHLFGIQQYRLFVNEVQNVLIAGSENEIKRVEGLLKETNLKFNTIPFPSTNVLAGGLDEYIRVYNIDEIVFCSKDIPAQEIIGTMLLLEQNQVDYKIAPPESLSVIGSNSMNTAGDLYTIGLNSITTMENRRKKRSIDVFLACFFLTISPLLLFLVQGKLKLYSNLLAVLWGRKTFVGFTLKSNHAMSKKGILTPAQILGQNMSAEMGARLDLLYVKDYKVSNDFKIIFKGILQLGT